MSSSIQVTASITLKSDFDIGYSIQTEDGFVEFLIGEIDSPAVKLIFTREALRRCMAQFASAIVDLE
ncbi:hypothetical protein EV192_101780 [Actinocrispum wychmicini]|uniref:Uncharacterized protein n=1 Tax=Actinocrispum wychmicini TaxID=1213861 RepID=A0A4R2K586_9PSEU|nr:hypothetical protein EV192_101780 [Actinocrispum wychmicini]